MSITQLVSSIRLKDSITFTLNSQSLNYNFDIVQKCLLKIKDLQAYISKSTQNTSHLQAKMKEMQNKITQNTENILTNQQKIKQLNANVGDQFMKKMYTIEEKTKNMLDFDQTARRIQLMNKFVLVTQFNDKNSQIQKQLEKVFKLRQDFDRYLLSSNFDKYKVQQSLLLQQKQGMINMCNEEIARLRSQIGKMNQSVLKVELNMKENNTMIKEINFGELLDKIKKFKDQTDNRVNQIALKMKKKVSQSELMNLEKSMIEKLDKFFADNEKNKAQKHETKQALVFLQKKINDIEDILTQKSSQQEKDAMFSLKKWQCASCTKDLGKYEGKLGQYHPWSVFPCKQMDPEKTGGFGYLNYIDKMSYKKGIENDDQSLQRLNKTFFQGRIKQSPSKRLGTTRGSNLITNYGLQEKGYSLKDVYFKETADRASTQRIFRVTKRQAAKLNENESKEIHQV